MRVPFLKPRLGADEVRAVTRALRDGHVGGNGALSRRVQAELERLTGARHALLCPSAPAALEVLLISAGIGLGDEVLMPSFAEVGLASVMVARGAIPVFCDLAPGTLSLDPSAAEARATARTRAVLAVHPGGHSADLAALAALAERRGLLLLEDASQALGATLGGRHLGTFGAAGLLSFDMAASAACGEGGALLTSDGELFERASAAHAEGTRAGLWTGAGGRFALSDLSAALLGAQLGRLDTITAARRRAAQAYDAGLAPLEQEGKLARLLPPPGAERNGHGYAFHAPDAAWRERYVSGLRARAVEALPAPAMLHASPYAERVLREKPEALPLTLAAAETLVRLPLHDRLRNRHIAHVLRALRDVARGG